jgi:hypothetical protein
MTQLVFATCVLILSTFILAAVSLGSAPSYAAGSHGIGHGAPSGKMEHMKGGHMDEKNGHGHSLDFGEAGKARKPLNNVMRVGLIGF